MAPQGEPRAMQQEPAPFELHKAPSNCTRSFFGFSCRGSRRSLRKAQFIGLSRTEAMPLFAGMSPLST